MQVSECTRRFFQCFSITLTCLGAVSGLNYFTFTFFSSPLHTFSTTMAKSIVSLVQHFTTFSTLSLVIACSMHLLEKGKERESMKCCHRLQQVNLFPAFSSLCCGWTVRFFEQFHSASHHLRGTHVKLFALFFHATTAYSVQRVTLMARKSLLHVDLARAGEREKQKDRLRC